LCAAKQTYDLFCAAGAPPDTERILRGCESSDWFWWFGDFDPNGAVSAFDALFRRNLRALYRALGEAPPAALAEPVSHGGGAPESHGAMQRST
jgi:alpha-amylase/alpha-mannosidase (GH57 family)